MNKAILSLYRTGTVKEIGKSNLKSLIQRGLIDDDGKLTKSGKVYALSKMSLVKQCEFMELKLKTIKLEYYERPEFAMLSYFKSLGYIGVSCEGGGLLTILKALMLDKLSKYNPFNNREDACSRYLEAQFVSLKDQLKEIISEINIVPKERFIKNFQEIISTPYITSTYPELSTDFASSMFDAIDKKTFTRVANKFAEDPYKFRNGWPDITLIKNGVVEFIEVKTSDKLHENQLMTIPVMRKILPFDFYVFKLIKIND